jgi:hypothetical protein
MTVAAVITIVVVCIIWWMTQPKVQYPLRECPKCRGLSEAPFFAPSYENPGRKVSHGCADEEERRGFTSPRT